MTEPVLTPIRRMIGWRMGMDLSPMIAILILVFCNMPWFNPEGYRRPDAPTVG